ncbi:coenzyme Q-binding protein COQ10 homolog, mitochondrial-like isoform 2-T2 [Liasis olivaceus]
MVTDPHNPLAHLSAHRGFLVRRLVLMRATPCRWARTSPSLKGPGWGTLGNRAAFAPAWPRSARRALLEGREGEERGRGPRRPPVHRGSLALGLHICAMSGSSHLSRSLDALRGLFGSGLSRRFPRGARLGVPHWRCLSSRSSLAPLILNSCSFMDCRLVMREQVRPFLNLAAPLLGAKRMEYTEIRQLPYSVDKMYDIVADVGSYQLFVPWCSCSRIISHHKEVSQAELEVGFPPVVERYVSEISSVPHCQIRAVSNDGRLFQHLETLWQFKPGHAGLDSCTLKFYVSFEFKSILHSQLANIFFNEVVKQMVSAFEQRAEKLYSTQTAAQPHRTIHCT